MGQLATPAKVPPKGRWRDQEWGGHKRSGCLLELPPPPRRGVRSQGFSRRASPSPRRVQLLCGPTQTMNSAHHLVVFKKSKLSGCGFLLSVRGAIRTTIGDVLKKLEASALVLSQCMPSPCCWLSSEQGLQLGCDICRETELQSTTYLAGVQGGACLRLLWPSPTDQAAAMVCMCSVIVKVNSVLHCGVLGGLAVGGGHIIVKSDWKAVCVLLK